MNNTRDSYKINLLDLLIDQTISKKIVWKTDHELDSKTIRFFTKINDLELYFFKPDSFRNTMTINFFKGFENDDEYWKKPIHDDRKPVLRILSSDLPVDKYYLFEMLERAIIEELSYNEINTIKEVISVIKKATP